MKRISLGFYLAITASLFLTSCVKDRNEGPDFSITKPVLELRTPIADMAGLAYFTRAVIGNLPDTVQFYANLASANTFDHDVNVTIGVDPSRIDEYNSDDANAVKYELLPDSAYSILKTTGTIVAGQLIDSFQVAFYKDKIDPTKNYMLPVAITDGGDVLISHNMGLIWFHAIGNPIAGAYLWDWTRWNATDSTDPATLSSLSFTGAETAFSPTSPTEARVPSGYYSQPDYIITFDNNGGVLSNFEVSLDQDNIDANFTPNGIAVTDGPHILFADGVTKTFRFQYAVLGPSGPRYCIDKYYK